MDGQEGPQSAESVLERRRIQNRLAQRKRRKTNTDEDRQSDYLKLEQVNGVLKWQDNNRQTSNESKKKSGK